MILIGLLNNAMTKPIHSRANETMIKSRRYTENTTQNAEVVQAMGLLPNVIGHWQKVNQDLHAMHSVVRRRETVITEVTKFIRMCLSVSVTGLGVFLAVKQQISTGAIIASSALVGRALAPAEHAIRSWSQFIEVRKAYQRLQVSLASDEDDSKKMSLPEPEGGLEVENVEYAPPGSPKPTLQNINFSLERGISMALIGPSASGKTTLARLIVGACSPMKGAVRIDGASLRECNREELGPFIGYLPQDVELFSGTIQDNIARMEMEPDAEAVIKAAKMAGVHDMILRLRNGYNTIIGPGGVGLSGGQRQRIGLARAFYKDPRVVVLDEPNASLDQVGESALHQAIISCKKNGVTTVIISHKTSILNLVDKIMFLKDGAVEMFGERGEIIKRLYSIEGKVLEEKEVFTEKKLDEIDYEKSDENRKE